jgi:Tol biopolymer transport system component
MVGQAMWFRDGKRLLQPVTDQQGKVSLYNVDLTSGEFTLLVTPESLVAGYGSAALSPNETAVYLPAAHGFTEGGVVALDLATGRETPIYMRSGPLGQTVVSNLALGPDGRTLAILELVDQVATISLVNLDGTGYHQLYSAKPNEGIGDGGTLAWTKDGRSIFFWGHFSGHDGLMRIAVNGGQPEFTGLTGKGNQLVHRMSLSPEGSRIAIGDGERETVEVWALDNLLPVLKGAK